MSLDVIDNILMFSLFIFFADWFLMTFRSILANEDQLLNFFFLNWYLVLVANQDRVLFLFLDSTLVRFGICYDGFCLLYLMDY